MAKKLTKKDKKEIIKLELEKIKIEHQNELHNINQFLSFKGILIQIILTSILGLIIYLIKFPSSVAIILFLLFYSLLIVGIGDYLRQMEYEGKPKGVLGWVIHIVFSILLFSWIKYCFFKNKHEEDIGLKGRYEKKIDKLIEELKK